MTLNNSFTIKTMIFAKNGFFIFIDDNNNSFKGKYPHALNAGDTFKVIKQLKTTSYNGKEQYLFSDSDFEPVSSPSTPSLTSVNNDILDVKLARVKMIKFHNTKSFIDEDPSTHSQWATWKDTNNNSYSGNVNFLDFKKNTIFNAVYSTKSHPVYGDQRVVSSTEIIHHNTSNIEDFLISSGASSKSISSIILDPAFSQIKTLLSSSTDAGQLDAKTLGKVPGLGPKTASKIIDNINKSNVSPVGAKEQFFALMKELFVKNYVSYYIGGASKKSNSDKIKILDKLFIEFSKLIEGQNRNFQAETGVDTILDVPKLLEKNPYNFIWVNGLGFSKCDEIALEMGIEINSPLRQEAAIRAVLNGDTGGFQGDIYINRTNLFDEVKEILSITDTNNNGVTDFNIGFSKEDAESLFDRIRNDKMNKYFSWLELTSSFELVDSHGNPALNSLTIITLDDNSKTPIFFDDKNNSFLVKHVDGSSCSTFSHDVPYSIFKNGSFLVNCFLLPKQAVSEQFTTIENYDFEKSIFDKVEDAINSSNNSILNPVALEAWIKNFENTESQNNGFQYKLSSEQKQAVRMINSGDKNIFTLTGYAGTGKSTVSKALLQLLALKYTEKDAIQCVAVSGMASRRITEATGFTASTVMSYLFNSDRIKKTQVLFIDESSMLDSSMLNEILEKIDTSKVRLLLAGDVGQLPAIGRGSPYKDILQSGFVDSVELKKIFRQSEDAIMTTVAKEIRTGVVDDIHLCGKHEDFQFVSFTDLEIPISKITSSIHKTISKDTLSSSDKKMLKKLYDDKSNAVKKLNQESMKFIKNLLLNSIEEFKKDIFSLQLISPQQDKGLTSVNDHNMGHTNLNLVAQDILNTDGELIIDTVNNLKLPNYNPSISGHKKFKIGDKVVNTLNQNWSFDGKSIGIIDSLNNVVRDPKMPPLKEFIKHFSVPHKKLGNYIRIMNGMVGKIHSFDSTNNLVCVEFNFEGFKIGVFYSAQELGSLSLAYALSVHKLQGSEAKTVVFVASPSHTLMLNQNLLYTGLTRGKTMAYIVGSRFTFRNAIKKVSANRKTLLPLLFESKLSLEDKIYSKLVQLDDFEHKSKSNNTWFKNTQKLDIFEDSDDELPLEVADSDCLFDDEF